MLDAADMLTAAVLISMTFIAAKHKGPQGRVLVPTKYKSILNQPLKYGCVALKIPATCSLSIYNKRTKDEGGVFVKYSIKGH